MASILDLNPEMRNQIAQATSGGDENSGPYKFNPADFNLVNGQYIPKDEKAFRRMVGLRPNEKYQPIKEYLLKNYLEPETPTEPFDFKSQYGVNPQYFIDQHQKRSGIDSKNEWLKAYEETKNPNGNNLFNSYGQMYVPAGVEITPTDYQNNNFETILKTEPKTKRILSPLAQRLYEYKNSDALIERLAGSHYNNEIDVNKWTADPIYRQEYTKKYLAENPKVSSQIIDQLRDRNPTANIAVPYADAGYSDSSGLGIIAVNPLFHGRNFKTEEEQYNAILDEAKKQYNSLNIDKNLIKSPEMLAKIWMSASLKDANTPEVLSHEAGHQFFNKENLVKDRNMSEDQIYPENKMLWELNQATKNGKMDYEKFKDLLGYAKYKYKGGEDQRELTHLESPEETKADIQSLRDYLYAKYNFDHIKDQFDEKTLSKLLQDKEWAGSLIGKRMLERFGNDKNAWMKAMNLIAKNDNPYTLKFA